MTQGITPRDVGKRVTVQFFDDEGGRREAVGLLERVMRADGALVFFVRKRDDSLVEVQERRIRFGKVV